jgi:hypothetical protein
MLPCLIKVTNPAVHEFGAATGSSFGKIVLLYQQRAVPARGCVNGNAEARRASADHEKIPGFSGVLNLVQDSVSFDGRSFLRSIVINAGLGTPIALHHLTRTLPA